MPTYYVNSGAGGANTGGSWTDAYLTFAQAVTAANADGDIIKVHKTHNEELGSDTTYAITNNVAVLCVDKDASDAPATMGASYWIGNSTTNRSVIVTAAAGKYAYLYGLTFRVSGTSTDSIQIRPGGDAIGITADTCYLWISNNQTAACIYLGFDGITTGGLVRANNCTFRFGAVGQQIFVCGRVAISGGSLSADGTIPTSGLFSRSSGMGGGFITIEGMNLSSLAANELVDNHAAVPATYQFINCKLGTGFTINEAETSYVNEVFIFNSSSGDEHYQFFHYNVLGQTSVSTGIYATDASANNKYNGTDRCSWKIVTSSYANYYCPYISPWFEMYHDGTAAITPSIEVLADRTGSPLKDDEIWGEWSYQGTSGSTQATFVNDRRALVGTAANQADSSLTASDWTGETAGSPTPWFGKLAPASAITPAEIGMLRARVCVGKPSTTVYVDPTPRYS